MEFTNCWRCKKKTPQHETSSTVLDYRNGIVGIKTLHLLLEKYRWSLGPNSWIFNLSDCMTLSQRALSLPGCYFANVSGSFLRLSLSNGFFLARYNLSPHRWVKRTLDCGHWYVCTLELIADGFLGGQGVFLFQIPNFPITTSGKLWTSLITFLGSVFGYLLLLLTIYCNKKGVLFCPEQSRHACWTEQGMTMHIRAGARHKGLRSTLLYFY